MVNLETKFCGVRFPTPLVQVSGIVHTPPAFLALAKEPGLGGITWKSVSVNPRAGYPSPVVAAFPGGYINAVGLKNPGMKQAIPEIKSVKKQIKIPLIASIVAFQLSELPVLAREIVKAQPDLVEINLSCPNVDDEIGRPFATDPLLTALAVMEVKKIVKKIPVIAKLTPNVIDIKEIALACEEAGADGISAINTAGPGLLIDYKTRKPRISNKVGGISGAAIKPLALRCVWQIANTVKIPVIGMGGINSGIDAVEMIMAGATLVGVGTAVFGKGNSVFGKIFQEMQIVMQEEKIKDLGSIRNSIK